MEFYTCMVSQAVNIPLNVMQYVPGVAFFTSNTLSSLNNIMRVCFLTDEKFAPFYDVTMEEFNNLMNHSSIPQNTKAKKEVAISYYNGNKCGNLSTLNTFSVVKLIYFGSVCAYCIDSGIAVGLTNAICFSTLREEVMKLLIGTTIKICLKNSINLEEFYLWKNACYEVENVDLIMNFLYQQRYVTVSYGNLALEKTLCASAHAGRSIGCPHL